MSYDALNGSGRVSTAGATRVVDESGNVLQDPIFDHANGAKVTVTTASTDILTPPANCRYARISADADVFVRTDGSAAADNGGAIRLVANTPEIIPVVAGAKLTGIVASGTAVVRCTPLKARG